MKLVTYRDAGGRAHPGIMSGDHVIGLPITGIPDMVALASRGLRDMRAISGVALSHVELLAPIPRPPKFICVGLNYRDHAIESGQPVPERPTIFSKFSSCVIGPGAPIMLPRNSNQPDYEAEFAFVIGKGGRHIQPEN